MNSRRLLPRKTAIEGGDRVDKGCDRSIRETRSSSSIACYLFGRSAYAGFVPEIPVLERTLCRGQEEERRKPLKTIGRIPTGSWRGCLRETLGDSACKPKPVRLSLHASGVWPQSRVGEAGPLSVLVSWWLRCAGRGDCNHKDTKAQRRPLGVLCDNGPA